MISTVKTIKSDYKMKYFNGSSFLNHTFIQTGFMSSWRDLISENHRKVVFDKLNENLNKNASINGSFIVTIPMAYLEFAK